MNDLPSSPLVSLVQDDGSTVPDAPPLPLERLRVPEAFDGRAGGNRAGPDSVKPMVASSTFGQRLRWVPCRYYVAIPRTELSTAALVSKQRMGSS